MLYEGRDKVVEFIQEKHGDQKRIHGGPYYLHPIAVTEIAYNRLGVQWQFDVLQHEFWAASDRFIA